MFTFRRSSLLAHALIFGSLALQACDSGISGISSSVATGTSSPIVIPAVTTTTNTATPTPIPTNHMSISCTLKTAGGLCDTILDLGNSTYTNWNGSSVPAGGLVCLKAGTHPYGKLIINNILGSSTNYTKIKNCGGTFSIGNSIDNNNDGIPDSSAGIEVANSKYFLLSGTGNSADYYGINLMGSSSGQSNMIIDELSTDFEVEYTQVANAGFAGIMSKTEPICTDTNPTSFRGGFVERNVSFHDNWIHDTQGEGFYIGFSFPDGLSTTCNGTATTVYSHPIDNLKIYNNLLERTGCEGIQFGMSTNADVYNNYINGFGRSPFSIYQNNGIQIGGKSGGKVHENFILNPVASFEVGSGIIIIGSEASQIYSNTIINAGDGMYIHNQAASGKTIDITNNTIVNPQGDHSSSHQGSGIWNNNSIATIRLTNNLIVLGPVVDTSVAVSQLPLAFGIYDQTQPQNQQRAGVFASNITATQNLRLNPGDATGLFKSASTYDYRVLTSNALNQGVSVTGLGVTTSMSVNTYNQTVITGARALSGTDIGAYETQ